MVCAASAAGASEVVSETIFPSRTPTSQLPTASGPTTRPPRTNRSSTYVLISAVMCLDAGQRRARLHRQAIAAGHLRFDGDVALRTPVVVVARIRPVEDVNRDEVSARAA